jgi:tetratricopeptide (TPR) repeat protein
MQGDIPGAIADYTRAAQFDPDPLSIGILTDRAAAHHLKGDYEGALAYLEKFIELKPEWSSAPLLYRHVILLRLGRPDADFNQTVASWVDSWEKTCGQFLNGNMSEADFLASAAKGDPKSLSERQCSAFYYIGALRLAHDDKAGALDFWAKCDAPEFKSLFVSQLAKSESLRLVGTTPKQDAKAGQG